jgi:hypothetical protein
MMAGQQGTDVKARGALEELTKVMKDVTFVVWH